MSLSGTLETFTVAEILSLLGAARTTGALRVWSGTDEGAVFCREGEVIFAAVGEDAGVGDVLGRGGFVPTSQWIELEQRADPGQELYETLSRRGIEPERVRRFLAKQTEESVFELDNWTSGELRFEPDIDHALKDFFRYPTADLLVSVDARRTRWNELLGRLGSLERIVHQAPVASDDDAEVSVSRTQLAVVAQVDGSRSIRQLARFLGIGLFQTCQTVADLAAAGLVQLRDERLDVRSTDQTSDPQPAGATASFAPATSPTPVPETPAPAAGDGPTEFVEAGDGPARDLILRLLSAVKEEL